MRFLHLGSVNRASLSVLAAAIVSSSRSLSHQRRCCGNFNAQLPSPSTLPSPSLNSLPTLEAKSAQQFVSFHPSSDMLLRVLLHQHCPTFYTITRWSHGSNFLCYQNVYFLLPHAVVAVTTQLTSICYVRPGSVVSLHPCGLVPNSMCHTMAPGLHPLMRM